MENKFQGKSILQGKPRSFPNDTTLTGYFTHGLSTGTVQPSHLALVDGEKQHTFQQLEDISSKIADAFLEIVQSVENLNPDGDRVIGVCIQPSDKLITILLGILKAGAAYVPFDITFPEARITKIVKDCRPLLVICDGRTNILGKFQSVQEFTTVISTEELYRRITPTSPKVIMKNASSNYCSQNRSEETAIILYTSGSSGEPKGVRLSHKSVMNRLSWQWKEFPFMPSEKCVFKTSLTFVDSVAEIFGPLLQGYQLVVFDKTITSQPPLFMEKLHAYNITRVVVVPSLLKAILQTISIIGKSEGSKLLNLVRFWVCSGEALTYDLVNEFFSIFPENVTLCNFYGSTEVMADVTFVTYCSIADVDNKVLERRVPIGHPIQNSNVYVLNENFELVEDGTMGEIFISGSNLAKGYVGVTESDKFLNNILAKSSDLDNATIYRTGDFGKIAILPNGESTLLFEGRIDSQIKIRGYRVDLSEIEATLSEFDSVSKVKVLCHHPGQNDQTIVAYIVPTSTDTTPDQLQPKLTGALRDYERPLVRLIKEIPLLVNGKTDRQRLLKMFEAEVENQEEFYDWTSLCIPTDKLTPAKVLFEIISDVTGSSLLTIAEHLDDSFFNVGGTSLNTVVVIVKLRERGYYISIPDFTLAHTIRDILLRISESEDDRGLLGHEESGKYIVSLLIEEDQEEVVHIISYSFSKKGDLEAYVNVSYDDYVTLIKSIWKDIVDKQLSFIVKRADSAKVVAVSLSFDVYDEPSGTESSSTGINYVMDFLEHVESQQRPRLPQGKGKLLHSFMMGTPEDVDNSERVALIEFMEEQNILLAKRNSFVGILTTNTNPLTMQIGRDLHGYETLSEFQVNTYIASDGTKPFCLAPDSFTIICCWKKL